MSRYHRLRVTRLTIILVGVAGLLVIFLVVVPRALRSLADLFHSDWQQYGNIGQAYGGISEIFGILALVGVVASLIYQVRDSHSSRLAAQRAVHNHLLQLSLDDPVLYECWGRMTAGVNEDRQFVYCNMIISFWNTEYNLGYFSEPQLRMAARNIFKGEPARRYWALAGPGRTHVSNEISSRIFASIIDEEYTRALELEPGKKIAPATRPEIAHGSIPWRSIAFGATSVLILLRVLSRVGRKRSRP